MIPDTAYHDIRRFLKEDADLDPRLVQDIEVHLTEIVAQTRAGSRLHKQAKGNPKLARALNSINQHILACLDQIEELSV